MFLSVVMPVYNEEASIRQVVQDHAAILRGMQAVLDEWEIVCVDDGSQDRTAEFLDAMQPALPRLRVVRQENQGIAGAVSRCYREARGTHVYFTGSDGQWPADILPLLFEKLKSGADLVIGVRTNRREVYTAARHAISMAFNFMPRLLFGVRVEDAGSVKLGRRELFVLDLISRSPFFEVERIIRAHRAGYQVAFVPIRFLPRTRGRAGGASWKNLRTSAWDLLRCIWTLGPR